MCLNFAKDFDQMVLLEREKKNIASPAICFVLESGGGGRNRLLHNPSHVSGVTEFKGAYSQLSISLITVLKC